MISLKQLQQAMAPQKAQCNSHDFLNLHRYTEAYVKRVLLIGLRVNGVKYKESGKIVESTFSPTASLVEKTLFLLDQSGGKHGEVIQQLKVKYATFFELNYLLTKFSAKYRNWLAHGTIDELKNEELINHLCHVNKSFMHEFENLLMTEHGHSAFDKPSDWGAKRGIPELIEKSAKRLGLGKILDAPLTLSVVQNRLVKIGHTLPVER